MILRASQLAVRTLPKIRTSQLAARTFPKALASHGVRNVAIAVETRCTRMLATEAAPRDEKISQRDAPEQGKEQQQQENAARPEASDDKKELEERRSSLRGLQPLFMDRASWFFDRDIFTPIFSSWPRGPFFTPASSFFKSDHWAARAMPVWRNDNAWLSWEKDWPSPGYEIRVNDSKAQEGGDGLVYEILIRIPEGLTASDMSVEVDEDSSVVHIFGQHKKTTAGTDTEKAGTKSFVSTRFDQRLSLGPKLNVDKLSANFSNGELVLSVPPEEEALKPVESSSRKRVISITTEKAPSKELANEDEILQKTFSDEFDESDWVEDGKKNHA